MSIQRCEWTQEIFRVFFLRAWIKPMRFLLPPADFLSKLIEFFFPTFKISCKISCFQLPLCSVNSHLSQIIQLKYNFLRAFPAPTVSPCLVTCPTTICFIAPTASASQHSSSEIVTTHLCEDHLINHVTVFTITVTRLIPVSVYS